MRETPFPFRRRVGPDDHGRLGLRRLLALPVLGLVTALALMLSPALASADSSSTLSVVGTSDVSDSGLMPNLIQPQFQAAFPQFQFKYTGSATGTAIQNAESGNGGPSVLIVHAASLENQFVGGGFSYQNRYGNAIWTNDFILAGPTGDPVGVSSVYPNNIAGAFAASPAPATTTAALRKPPSSRAAGPTPRPGRRWRSTRSGSSSTAPG